MTTLTDEQTDLVIEIALEAGMFERAQDGSLPDRAGLQKAAIELVRQARLAHAAGNRNPKVAELLFIAEVDQVVTSRQTGIKGVASSMSLSADELQKISEQPDILLGKLYATLGNYEPSQEVDENLTAIRAEMQKRGLEVPGLPSAGNGHSAPAQESAPQQAAQEMVVTKEILGPEQTDSFLPPADDAAERKVLVDRLSFGAMRKHGIDPSEVDGLSIDALRFVVEHPGGEESAQVQNAPQQEAPVQQPEPRGETIETTRMVVPEPVSPTPPPLSQTQTHASEQDISPERLALEEQVTGPMLKVFGRGRNQIADGTIGDNELAFMIANPDGKVTLEQLQAAQALDKDSSPAPEVAQESPPTVAEQNRAQKESVQAPPAARDDAFSPPPAEASVTESQPQTATQQQTSDPVVVPPTPSTPARGPLLQDLPENPAAATIERENFPFPPEIEGTPPRLPFDMSKCSDDDLRSLHAMMHAVHARANVVVGLWEGELRDIVKLRKGREVHVMNNLPQKDGRVKYTDAQREAMVQADAEVIGHREREHEIERVLRQLSTLRDGYSRDVTTCSRQWSMRHREAEGAGGLRS